MRELRELFPVEINVGRFTLRLYTNQRLGIALWRGTVLFDCSVWVPAWLRWW